MENTNNNHIHEENSCKCEEGGKNCCKDSGQNKWRKRCGRGYAGAPSCIYGMALVGTAIYYIQQADTFGAGALGILKAIVWPAIVIYNVLGFLGM